MRAEQHTCTVIERTPHGDRNFTVAFVLSLDEAIDRVRRSERTTGELLAIWGKL